MPRVEQIQLIGQEEPLLESIRLHHKCQVWEQWAEALRDKEVPLPVECLQECQLDSLQIYSKWLLEWIQR